MHALTNDFRTAVVILHEIYGVNRYMMDMCAHFHARGHDVFCPNMLGRESPFSYAEEAEAYAWFMDSGGFAVAGRVCSLTAKLAAAYSRVFLIGYSVGATVAWIVGGKTACAGVVCHYGTRIREHAGEKPSCPALLVCGTRDRSFPGEAVVSRFDGAPGIEVAVFEGEHGFCDPYGPVHCRDSADKARLLADTFIERLR